MAWLARRADLRRDRCRRLRRRPGARTASARPRRSRTDRRRPRASDTTAASAASRASPTAAGRCWSTAIGTADSRPVGSSTLGGRDDRGAIPRLLPFARQSQPHRRRRSRAGEQQRDRQRPGRRGAPCRRHPRAADAAPPTSSETGGHRDQPGAGEGEGDGVGDDRERDEEQGDARAARPASSAASIRPRPNANTTSRYIEAMVGYCSGPPARTCAPTVDTAGPERRQSRRAPDARRGTRGWRARLTTTPTATASVSAERSRAGVVTPLTASR